MQYEILHNTKSYSTCYFISYVTYISSRIKEKKKETASTVSFFSYRNMNFTYYITIIIVLYISKKINSNFKFLSIKSNSYFIFSYRLIINIHSISNRNFTVVSFQYSIYITCKHANRKRSVVCIII